MASFNGLSIGSIHFDGCAFLAPMAGITDRSFRAMAEKFGAPSVTSEMIASAALGTGHHEMVRKLAHTGQLPHIVQLAGNEEKWLVEGAKIAMDSGADIIDINLGCPSKRVTNGYAGSALMRVPDQALRLIESVVTTANVPVTVKMRLGWNDECLNAAQIARSAHSVGVQLVTVHARTRQQFYKGIARWHLVAEIVDALDIPVVVNGDIVDHTSARTALDQSGAAAVMVGRGAQGQPWLIGNIARALRGDSSTQFVPKQRDVLPILLEHYDLMLSEYGMELGVRVSRKHINWYAQQNGIEIDKQTSRQILTGDTPEMVKKLVCDAFNRSAEKVAA